LPSSLTEDRSSTLGSLPLPTCVGVRYGSCGLPLLPCGRKAARGFSGRPGDHTTTRASTAPPVSPANIEMRPGFAWASSPGPTPPPVHSGRGCFLSRPPLASYTKRARVQDSLTCSPSPTPPDNQRPRLRIRLTLGRLPLPRNPQASGVAGSSPPFALLIPAFSLVGAPSGPSGPPSPLPTTLPYHVSCLPKAAETSVASGGCLSPVTLSAQGHSTSELLRTLSRMAASKPTSWLSARPHYLSHSAAL
jgi:hypothetical protein